MNKARIAALDKIYQRLDECSTDINTIMEEEQDAYDALPESFQMGDKGSTIQNAIDQMSEAIDSIQTAMDCLMSAQE